MFEFLIISLLLALGACGVVYNSKTRQSRVTVPSADISRHLMRGEPRA